MTAKLSVGVEQKSFFHSKFNDLQCAGQSSGNERAGWLIKRSDPLPVIAMICSVIGKSSKLAVVQQVDRSFRLGPRVGPTGHCDLPNRPPTGA
jgi:hypothetical protein